MFLLGEIFIPSMTEVSTSQVDTWRVMLSQAQRQKSTNLLKLALAEAQKTYGPDSRESGICTRSLEQHLKMLEWLDQK